MKHRLFVGLLRRKKTSYVRLQFTRTSCELYRCSLRWEVSSRLFCYFYNCHNNQNLNLPLVHLFQCVEKRNVTTLPDRKRKHNWKYDELVKETNRLIDFLNEIFHDHANHCTNSNEELNRALPVVTSDDLFNTLEGWMELSKDGVGIDAARRAQSLLNALELWTQRNPSNSGISAKTSFYDVVLQTFALCSGTSEAASECESILQNMIRNCLDNNNQLDNKHRQPTTKTFNIVINAWAKSDSLDGGERAESVLQLMQKWNITALSKGYNKCLPNEITIASVINAWSRSKHPTGPDRALEILLDCLGHTRSEPSSAIQASELYENIKLDIVVFNSVLNAWAKSKRGKKAAIKVEELLHWLIDDASRINPKSIKPTCVTFGIIIDAWSECELEEGKGDAAERAEKNLLTMIDLYRQGMGIKPTPTLFAMCIRAWSRCKDTTIAPLKAENLFHIISQLYEESMDESLKPTTEVGNAVLTAWARSYERNDATSQLFAFFEKMKHSLLTNIVSYNIVLGFMGKKGHARETLQLLDWMEEEDDVALRPDVVTYNNTISAFYSAEEAERILNRMKQSPFVSPCRISYSLVINKWSQSASRLKVQNAFALIKEMLDLYESGNEEAKPDIHNLTVFLKCCAQFNGSIDEKKNTLQYAFWAMDAIESLNYGTPNHVAYATFFSAITNLCTKPEERIRYLNEKFRKCCESGNVSKIVIDRLIEGTGKQPKLGQLRPDWIRNVPSRERPPEIFIAPA